MRQRGCRFRLSRHARLGLGAAVGVTVAARMPPASLVPLRGSVAAARRPVSMSIPGRGEEP